MVDFTAMIVLRKISKMRAEPNIIVPALCNEMPDNSTHEQYVKAYRECHTIPTSFIDKHKRELKYHSNADVFRFRVENTIPFSNYTPMKRTKGCPFCHNRKNTRVCEEYKSGSKEMFSEKLSTTRITSARNAAEKLMTSTSSKKSQVLTQTKTG